jgi:hypothetical protein
MWANWNRVVSRLTELTWGRKGNMLQKEIVDEIAFLIQRRVIKQEGFTAYDITKELRAMFVRCKHDDVKTVVHETFDNAGMAGYSRELRDLGGNGPAWYYFHRNDYASQQYAGQTTAVTPPGHTLSAAFCGTTVPQSGLTAKADARLTVCIPSKAIKQINLQPGDEVMVTPLPTQNCILVRAPGKGRTLLSSQTRFYTVDKDCNIRFTRGVLVDADVSSNVFLVEVINDEIVLRPES